MASTKYPGENPFTVAELTETFRAFVVNTDHAFWPDTISVTDSQRFHHLRILSPLHLTDLYLVALAQEYRGCLVTFDRGILTAALSGFRLESLKVL